MKRSEMIKKIMNAISEDRLLDNEEWNKDLEINLHIAELVLKVVEENGMYPPLRPIEMPFRADILAWDKELSTQRGQEK